MKPLLFSSLLLGLLIFGVFFGGWMTARSIDGVRDAVEALPEDQPATPEAAEEVHALWQRCERFYLLTLDHRVLGDLDRAVANLCGTCAAGETAPYIISRHELLSLLIRLREEAGNSALGFL